MLAIGHSRGRGSDRFTGHPRSLCKTRVCPSGRCPTASNSPGTRNIVPAPSGWPAVGQRSARPASQEILAHRQIGDEVIRCPASAGRQIPVPPRICVDLRPVATAVAPVAAAAQAARAVPAATAPVDPPAPTGRALLPAEVVASGLPMGVGALRPTARGGRPPISKRSNTTMPQSALPGRPARFRPTSPAVAIAEPPVGCCHGRALPLPSLACHSASADPLAQPQSLPDSLPPWDMVVVHG